MKKITFPRGKEKIKRFGAFLLSAAVSWTSLFDGISVPAAEMPAEEEIKQEYSIQTLAEDFSYDVWEKIQKGAGYMVDDETASRALTQEEYYALIADFMKNDRFVKECTYCMPTQDNFVFGGSVGGDTNLHDAGSRWDCSAMTLRFVNYWLLNYTEQFTDLASTTMSASSDAAVSSAALSLTKDLADYSWSYVNGCTAIGMAAEGAWKEYGTDYTSGAAANALDQAILWGEWVDISGVTEEDPSGLLYGDLLFYGTVDDQERFMSHTAIYLGEYAGSGNGYYQMECLSTETAGQIDGRADGVRISSFRMTNNKGDGGVRDLIAVKRIFAAEPAEEEYFGYLTLKKSSSADAVTAANRSYDLAGAVYSVYTDAACTKSAGVTLTTKSDGSSNTVELSLGTDQPDQLVSQTFYIKETTAPKGYQKDNTIYPVTVKSGTTENEPLTLTVSDTPAASSADLIIVKQDGESGNTPQGDSSLSDAQFCITHQDTAGTTQRSWIIKTIYNASAGRYEAKLDKSHLVSGELYTIDGEVVLPLGTYTVTESSAPAGYRTDDAVFTADGTRSTGSCTFTVTQKSGGASASVSLSSTVLGVSDTVIRGGVEIYKIDDETGGRNAQGDATLAGASFAIVNDGENPVYVNGIRYAVGSTVSTIQTDAYGYACTDETLLPYGTYIIKETSSPTGYLKEGVTERSFSVRAQGELVDMTSADHAIRNIVEKGSGTFSKIDAETNGFSGMEGTAQGDAALSGAEFTLVNTSENAIVYNGKAYFPGEVVAVSVTGESGLAQTIDALPYGTYRVQETKAPAGYLLDETPYTFTIREDGQAICLSLSDSVIRGGIALYKTEGSLVATGGAAASLGIAEGDASLKGAVYEIKNVSSHPVLVGNVLYDPGEVVLSLTTDERGYAETDSRALPYGTYEIYEVQPSEGNLLNDRDVVTVQIRNDGERVTLDAGEIAEPTMRQAFQIVKVSSDGTSGEISGVEGAEFTIYNASLSVVVREAESGDDSWYYPYSQSAHPRSVTIGAAVDAQGNAVGGTTYFYGDAIETITTDKYGYACSDRLPYGTYVVIETNTPKDMLSTTPFVVQIREDSDEPQVWRYFNDAPMKAYIKMVKQDAKTGQSVLLANTHFRIRNVSGTAVTVGGVTFADGDDIGIRQASDLFLYDWYTNEEGYVTTALTLPCGSYELYEVEAPWGYVCRTDGIRFTVSSDTYYELDAWGCPVITVSCVDEEVSGTVKIYKHGEALTGALVSGSQDEGTYRTDFSYEDRPLSGSTFIIVADEDIYTPDGWVNADGTRTIATYNGVECYAGAVLATVTTGSDGYAIADGLPVGYWEDHVWHNGSDSFYPSQGGTFHAAHYHIEEIGVTSGYTLSSYVDSFTLSWADQDTPVVFYESDYKNSRVTTDLSLRKTGRKSHEPIEGAVYGLYTKEDIVSADGVVIASAGSLLDTAATDEDGRISWAGDLPLGRYFVKELARAKGTLLDECIYYEDVSYAGPDTPVVSAQFAVTDDETELIIYKLDQTNGENLTGAVLRLSDEGGDIIDEWTSDGEAHTVYRAEGVCLLYELSAPAGYVTIGPDAFYVLLTSESQMQIVFDDVTKLSVSKLDASTGEPLAGAAFAIYDEKGGLVESFLSGEEPYYVEKIPVGTYILHEESAPYGYETAEDVTFTVYDTGDVQNFLVSDSPLTIETSAKDMETDAHVGSLPDEEVTIVDEVTMRGLLIGRTYTVSGTLMDKDTGEAFLVNGQSVMAETTFTATSSAMSVDVVFTFDGSALLGKTVVAFEKLLRDGTELLAHEDIEEEEQAVYYPMLWTSAFYEYRYDQTGENEDQVVIYDTVWLRNLMVGEDYIIWGDLLDGETEEPILSDGSAVIAMLHFTATDTDMELTVQFPAVDVGLLAGKTIKLFETLVYNGIEIALDDIEDPSEELSFPSVRTTATDDKTGTHTSRAEEDVLINDLVILDNLTVGETYTVSGTLMDKETGEPVTVSGAAVCAETTFTAKDAHAEVVLTFTFDGSAYAGRSVVAFEKLLSVDSRTGSLGQVASHEDIDDPDQTVSFPSVYTTAADEKSGSHKADADENMRVCDQVILSGLCVGEDYLLRGVLMDKATGEELLVNGVAVCAEAAFTATDAHMEITLSFAFDGSGLGGHALVAFERLYQLKEETGEEILVGEHADINDADQTVFVNEPKAAEEVPAGKGAASPKTADLPILPMIAVLLLGAGLTLTEAAARKKEQN